MKKVLYIIILMFFTTGCTYQNLNDMKIEDCAQYVIENNTNVYNVSNIGYRYYLPRGFKVIGDDEYNSVLFSSGYNYYMNVDIVSYYNKIEPDYVYNGDIYLSQPINYGGKKGYLEIEKKDNSMFFVEMMYNNAKIEVLLHKNDLKSGIINISYILSSVRYNKSVIANKVGIDRKDFKEKEYRVAKPENDSETKNILDYAKEYDKYNDVNNELPDTDLVGE